MKKASCIIKDSNNRSQSRFGYFHRSLVNFKNFLILFLEHMGYLWFTKKLRKCCFWFGTYKKRFVIRDPELLNSIPGWSPRGFEDVCKTWLEDVFSVTICLPRKNLFLIRIKEIIIIILKTFSLQMTWFGSISAPDCLIRIYYDTHADI